MLAKPNSRLYAVLRSVRKARTLLAGLLLAVLATLGCHLQRNPTPMSCVENEDFLLESVHKNRVMSCAGEFELPFGVTLDDEVTEDEAVATALRNNSAFQATLAQLGMAQGDLIQAGLLTNPNFGTFLPVSVKQWEWTLFLPMEAFLLRKLRVEIAESQYENIAHQLEQNGLTLVRDVRVAHADLALAIARWKLALEAESIQQHISDLTEKRLDRGDISELEAMTARIDVLNASVNADLMEQNVLVARSRLALMMGLPPEIDQLDAPLTKPTEVGIDTNSLLKRAIASRPDLQAARWNVEALAQRERLSHWLFIRVDAVADANARGRKGFEVGPGLRFDIPIFNRNQGGITRAQAELNQAEHARDFVYEQIVQEVRAASAQWVQASKQLSILENQVGPSLQETLKIAEKGYADGGTDYLLVLRTVTQYLDARTRILDQIAALRRARAELERSIAGRLDGRVPGMPEEIPPPVATDVMDLEASEPIE